MTDILSGELLVLALLVLTCSRIFFSKKITYDSLSIISVVAFLLSVLQILAWTATLRELTIFILALFVLICNIHALSRLSSRLILDIYSPAFTIASLLFMVIALLLAAILILYRPVKTDPATYGVTETTKIYSGDFQHGFTEPANWNKHESCVLTTFNKKGTNVSSGITANRPIILFIPDKRVSVQNYQPYLLLLAQRGYTVLAADFYSKDETWISPIADRRIFRSTILLIMSLCGKKTSETEKERYTYNYIREYMVLRNIALQKIGQETDFFLVTDGIGTKGASDAVAMGTDFTGSFSLREVSEFATSGFGCVEQTDVPLAIYFGLKRDPSCATPRYLEAKTVNYILENKKSHNTL